MLHCLAGRARVCRQSPFGRQSPSVDKNKCREKTLHAGRALAREGGQVGTELRRTKCLCRPAVQHVSFRCAQLCALWTSFPISESCFSIRAVWDDYRFGGSLMNDIRHLEWVARVSANFQVFRNTEPSGRRAEWTSRESPFECKAFVRSHHCCVLGRAAPAARIPLAV